MNRLLSLLAIVGLFMATGTATAKPKKAPRAQYKKRAIASKKKKVTRRRAPKKMVRRPARSHSAHRAARHRSARRFLQAAAIATVVAATVSHPRPPMMMPIFPVLPPPMPVPVVFGPVPVPMPHYVPAPQHWVTRVRGG